MIPDLSILIPAAGKGERMGMGPKAMLALNNQPLIYWVTKKALKLTDDVVVAVPPEYKDEVQTFCPDCRCITGGSSRQESVARLLASSGREWVLLADVARPFISLDLLKAVVDAARKSGAAGAFLLQEVPVARLVQGEIKQVVKAKEAGLFQLPHAFKRELLEDVYKQVEQEGWREQSTLELVIRAGHPVTPVDGEKNNIKLTAAFDWQFAVLLEKYLE